MQNWILSSAQIVIIQYVFGYVSFSPVAQTSTYGSCTSAGVALVNANLSNGADIFVAKYVDTVVRLAVKGRSFEALSSDIGRAIAVNGNNIYVVGSFDGSASLAAAGTNNTDFYLAKFVDNGNTLTPT
ncbi:hypothetical protein [Spirosoma flavus]